MYRFLLLILWYAISANGTHDQCKNGTIVVTYSPSGVGKHVGNSTCPSAVTKSIAYAGLDDVVPTTPGIVYSSMPQLFELENYDRCLAAPQGTYCVMDLDLAYQPSQLYTYIMEYSSHSLKHYYHARLHRGVCVSRKCGLNSTRAATGTKLLKCMNETIHQESGMQVAQVKVHYCNSADDVRPPLDGLDKTVAIIVLSLVVLAIYGTTHHIMLNNGYIQDPNPYALAFSVIRNWQILKAGDASGSEDSDMMRSMQGMRFFTMLLVIGSHGFLILGHGYVSNPEFIETSYENPLIQFIYNGRVVVQTFFLMSGFLLTHHFIKNLFDRPFTLRYLPTSILNRYIRLMPAVLITVALSATWIQRIGSGPLWNMVVTKEMNICRSGWWRQVLLIQNYFTFDKVCLPQTWYLAADTQLYIAGLIIMTLLWKFQQHARLIFGSVLTVSLLIPALQTYFFSMLPIRVALFPEALINLFVGNNTFLNGYLSTQANWTGYILGMMTAYIHYVAQKNQWNLQDSAVMKWAYYSAIPVGILSLLFGSEFHSRQASTLEAVIFNTLDHNVFALAMCVFLLGCIYKIDRIMRACVEWAPLQPLGRLSLGALLLHTAVLRTYIGQQPNLMHVGSYSIIFMMMGAVVITFVLAIPMFLLVEQPACQLQKLSLGISKMKIKNNKDVATPQDVTPEKCIKTH